ncbi:hypothetical protein ACYOEI_12125 [Singulisphaera rosea]
MNPLPSRPHPKHRRGTATIFVLISLVLITLVCGVLLKVVLAGRGRLRSEERRLQVEWLVESGLERAASKLELDAKYSGETWELSARELGGLDAALVKITVDRPDNTTALRHVHIEADYPRESTRRARLSKTALVRVGSTPKDPRP